MVILGIDTSLRSTGYGVLKVEGSRLSSLDHGNIPNAPNLRHSECLRRINEKVSALVDEWAPDVFSVEKVIYGKNAAR